MFRGSSLGLLFVALLAWPLGTPSAAEAQRDILLSAEAGDAVLNDVARSAEQLRAHLPGRLMGSDALKAEIIDHHSASPEAVQAGDLEALRDCAQGALVLVASGQHQQAQERVLECVAISSRALTTINSEQDAARQLFNACLYMVRARVDLGDDDGARAELLRCRQLVPDLSASSAMHPPAVVALVEEVDRELQARQEAVFSIDTKNHEPCDVLVSGRDLGRTPFQTAELIAGIYEVQLNCAGGPSRVYQVQVRDTASPLVEIDTELDQALQTEAVLGLRYRNPEFLNLNRATDGTALADALGRDRIFLMSSDGMRMRIDRIENARNIASVWLPWDPGARRLADLSNAEQAFDALLEGRSMDYSAAPPAPRERWRAPNEPPSVDAPTDETADSSILRPVIGWTSAALAVGGYIATWTLYARRADLGNTARMPFVNQANYEAAKPLHLITSALTIPFAITSIALLAPEVEGVPWWAWASGVAGLGLASWGVVSFLQDGCSTEDGTVRCTYTEDVGWAWISQSVPFLALPLTYLLRSALSTDAALDVTANANGAHFLFRTSL